VLELQESPEAVKARLALLEGGAEDWCLTCRHLPKLDIAGNGLDEVTGRPVDELKISARSGNWVFYSSVFQSASLENYPRPGCDSILQRVLKIRPSSSRMAVNLPPLLQPVSNG
jgi:hypothetical protein